jgi:hypothetical protein
MRQNTDLLDLTGLQAEPLLIRKTVELLSSRDHLGGILSSATVPLPGISDIDMPVPTAWRLIPAFKPIVAANDALQNASDDGHQMLVLLGPVLPGMRQLEF